MSNTEKEYLVQVSIIEARCLKPRDESGKVNPFVKIKCGNLPIQSTQVMEDRLEANWNQSFTFDGLRLTDQGLQTTELSIQLYSKNNFFSNDLIGMYSIGLSTLYNNANHEFYNRWMVLFNQDDDPEEAQGYLLINAFIIGPGDRPPVHDRNEQVNQDVAEEDEEVNIDGMTFEQLRAYQEKMQSYQMIGKPMVARKGFQLSCYIFRAESIASFGGKKPNAFVSCRVAGLVRRTKTGKDNYSPTFNEKMLFPCYFPFLNDKILLRMWSENGSSKDIFIANIPEVQQTNDYFNLSKLISMGGRMPAKWVNLYGIPDEERNKTFQIKKTKHPDEGTAFMGRVLLSFSLLPEEVPACRTMPTNPFYEREPDKYNLFCDIYELKYLKPDQYDVAVWCDCKIGAYTTEKNKPKKPREKKKNSVEWTITDEKNEITLPSITYIAYPKDYAQVPDIFINLYTGPGGKKDDFKRIGYIRLKAETVINWTMDPTPRWLHFESIDKNKASPGTVLINLQFMSSTDSSKRIFKQIGIKKRFQLFAHIVNGFELCPKEKDPNLITTTKVELADEESRTKEKTGRFPVWNEILRIECDLDWKLDFCPDVVVTCYKKVPKGVFSKETVDEEIGSFTVPVATMKKLKKYPHYYNLINKGEIVGRIMALFFIVDSQNKAKAEYKFGEIYKTLENIRYADLKIFLHGVRNLDYAVDKNKVKYNCELTIDGKDYHRQGSTYFQRNRGALPRGEEGEEGEEEEEKEREENNKGGKKKGKTLAEDINYVKDVNYANILDCFEYKDIPIRGNKEFQLFPYVKIWLEQEKTFYNDEKFIVFNLDEFVANESLKENKKKTSRLMFQQNLGVTTLTQEQHMFRPNEIKGDEISMDVDEDEISEENKYQVVDDDNYDVMALISKKNKKNKEKKEEDQQETIKVYNRTDNEKEDRELARKIKAYKNMMVEDIFGIECKPKDKKKEKEIMRGLRKKFYSELKSLRKIQNPTREQSQRLMDLEEKFRDAKKPQMNESMFFGFEDITDDYSYGREIYKEDIYENHPNLKIPYTKQNLCYIPGNPLNKLTGDCCETMEGYYKLGKQTDTIIKYNVKLLFKDVDPNEEVIKENESERSTELKGPKLVFASNELMTKELSASEKLEKEIDKESEEYDVFNNTFQRKLRYIYLHKDQQKLNKAESLKIPLNNLRVRLYIYRCLNLAAQDNYFGFTDKVAGFEARSQANAYLQIQIGDKKDDTDDKGLKYIDTKDAYVANTLSPDFYQFFEMESDLPKEWKLTINVMTHSSVGTDSLIGSTVIDLEDRYLGEYRTRSLLKYKSYESDIKDQIADLEKQDDSERDNNELSDCNKRLDIIRRKIQDLQETKVPVEYRKLMKPDTKTAQGTIEMFVEILPPSRAKIIPRAVIERPPPAEYEIRLVIWETRELAYEGRKTIDAMIDVTYDPEGYLGKAITKQTDVHLGCENGRAKFNWRMKFDLVVPCTFPRLSFKLKDFNAFKDDEGLSNCTISIKRLLKKLVKEGRLELKDQWIQLSNRDDPGESKGEIKIDLYIIPKYEADQNKVGEAQDEPNHSPKLYKPKEGRGISDFLKGTFLDFSGWKWNFSLFGTLKVLIIIAIVVILLVILFVQPGILVK